ncbi:formyltransferase family protein [Pararhizobium sp. LjRoot238]|uniref:formyltransferase family protein n=1 Tax=Pararhizobium sp. LjRoot238 TaxID=3342293 RepID=UPI003ECEDB3F
MAGIEARSPKPLGIVTITFVEVAAVPSAASASRPPNLCYGLPLHRGRNAVELTIAAGDRVAGGSVYHLTDEVDEGPIAFQDWCFVHRGENAGDLWRRALAPIGAELLVKAAGHLSAYGFIPADDQEKLGREAR